MSRTPVYSVNELTTQGYSFDTPSFSPLIPSTTQGGFDISALGGLIGSGGDVSGIATVGLNAATGGLFSPVSSFLSTLTGFDIMGNIGNVTKYGLSSWGASTNPDEMQLFLQNAEKTINEHVSKISNMDIDSLTEMSRYINWGVQFYTRMRKNHAKAKSTQLAYDMAIKAFTKFKTDLLNPLVSALKSKGLITELSVTKKANDYPMQNGNYPYSSDPAINYSEFTLNQDKYRELLLKQQELQQSANTDENQIEVSTSEAGSGGVLGFLGLLAFAYYKLK